MFFYAGLMLLVLVVSFDTFFVGVTYGMRRIKVPHIALLIIMLCNMAVISISMSIGNWLSTFISSEITEKIGGAILILIGLIALYNGSFSKDKEENNCEKLAIKVEPKEKEWRISLNKLGLFITIRKEPQYADLDHSGTISAKEAIILGLACALDSFGAGLGAAMMGYPLFLTASLVGLMGAFFVYLGIKSGFALSNSRLVKQMAFLPPCILILLGFIGMF